METATETFFYRALQSMHFKLHWRCSRIPPLRERYRQIGKLGEGGMATVWKIQDTQLLRTVALKELRHDKLSLMSAREFHRWSTNRRLSYSIRCTDSRYSGQRWRQCSLHNARDSRANVEKVIYGVHKYLNPVEPNKEGWNLRRLIEIIVDLCQNPLCTHARVFITHQTCQHHDWRVWCGPHRRLGRCKGSFVWRQPQWFGSKHPNHSFASKRRHFWTARYMLQSNLRIIQTKSILEWMSTHWASSCFTYWASPNPCNRW